MKPPEITNKTVVVMAGAIIVTLLRMTVPGHDLSYAGSYEAFAHLFVGGLLGAWYVSRDHWLLAVVGVMSFLELLAFLAG